MLHYAPEVEAITRGEIEYQRHFEDGRVVLSRNPSGRRGRKFEKMPRGFLVTLLMLARGTWHRIESLRGLRVGDILLTRDQIRRKLLDMDPRLLFSCASFMKARDAVKEIEDETARENEASRLAARRYAEALLKSDSTTKAGAESS